INIQHYTDLVGIYITVDPGRRDLLYFVRVNPTLEELIKYRYLTNRLLVTECLSNHYAQTTTSHRTLH
ncbi:uncharacterized protein BX663DRAFT_420178, partial [Cokeromyces recurvatus]|uniref:uncharacterized protein n=1 Tax=Cokeromyces recurvatus TaxID=90255 RepID=UPI0022204073